MSYKKPVLKNRVPQEIEDAIVALGAAPWSGPDQRRPEKAWAHSFAGGRALRVATPRSRNHEQTARALEAESTRKSLWC